MSKIAIIDLDSVAYSAASVGERRFIEVVNNATQEQLEFKTKEEFCGRNSKGGWLADENNKRASEGLLPLSVEGFTIAQKQVVEEPLPNVLHSAKLMVEGAVKASGATQYEAFIGHKEDYRLLLSNLMEYKGNRKSMLKPLLLKDVKHYLINKFKATKVSGIETDDAVVIRCVELLKEGKDAFVITIDKDAMGCPIKVYNPKKPEQGVVECRGFGSLTYDTDASKVRGKGRLFKYFQIAYGDATDNYKANAKSSLRWGEKSAYNVLKDCTDDRQAWQALSDTYKKLYPKPFTFTTWRGESLNYTWLDCLQEITDMAHMQRWKGDRINVRDVLKKLDISTEENLEA